MFVHMCAQLCLTLCDPWTVAQQAPLSMEFSRQEYWSRFPLLTPGDLPNPGIKPALCLMHLQGGFVTTSITWGAMSSNRVCLFDFPLKRRRVSFNQREGGRRKWGRV